MCLIAFRDKKGTHIPNDVIKYNLGKNPDGFGLAWYEGGALLHEKFAPADHEAFVGHLKSLDKTDVKYAAHWRYATHGAPSYDLSHPFPYQTPEGVKKVLFHNGIINGVKIGQGQSDTTAFVDQVLRHLPNDWPGNPGITTLLDKMLGWSRLLIMDDEGWTITNNEAWTTVDGVRYSTAPITRPAQVSPKVSPSATSTRPVLALPVGTTLPESVTGKVEYWLHMSHIIHLIDQDEPDEKGDVVGEAECETCGEAGDFYILDNVRYTDISHRFRLGEDDDNEREWD